LFADLPFTVAVTETFSNRDSRASNARGFAGGGIGAPYEIVGKGYTLAEGSAVVTLDGSPPGPVVVRGAVVPRGVGWATASSTGALMTSVTKANDISQDEVVELIVFLL